MSLKEYLGEIYDLLSSSPDVTTFSLSFDERSTKAAYLHGTVDLIDGSSLRFKEFLVADHEI